MKSRDIADLIEELAELAKVNSSGGWNDSVFCVLYMELPVLCESLKEISSIIYEGV